MKTEAVIKKQIKELYSISQNAPSDIKRQAAYYAEALTWVIENPRWSCVSIVKYRLTEKTANENVPASHSPPPVVGIYKEGWDAHPVE